MFKGTDWWQNNKTRAFSRACDIVLCRFVLINLSAELTCSTLADVTGMMKIGVEFALYLDTARNLSPPLSPSK